jgi:hypothetical protein
LTKTSLAMGILQQFHQYEKGLARTNGIQCTSIFGPPE